MVPHQERNASYADAPKFWFYLLVEISFSSESAKIYSWTLFDDISWRGWLGLFDALEVFLKLANSYVHKMEIEPLRGLGILPLRSQVMKESSTSVLFA